MEGAQEGSAVAAAAAAVEESNGYQADAPVAAVGMFEQGVEGNSPGFADDSAHQTAAAEEALAEVPKKLRLELGWELFKPSEEEEEEPQLEFALTMYDVKVRQSIWASF
jgi:hypothetical protein